MEYNLIRSWRKTLSLSLADDGTLLVRAPKLMSVRRIEEFIRSKESWIKEKQAALAERRLKHPPKTELQQKEQIERSYSMLLPLVKEYSERMDVRPTRVRVTKAEKRFGSCSSAGHVCFSYRLIEYPEDAIRYVVVHELAHMKELNHSARFWSIVEKYCPDYKNCQKMLLK